MRTPFTIAAFAAAFTLAPVCAPAESLHDTVHLSAPKNDRLFRSFGGEARLTQVVETFAALALEDPRIAQTFEETNMTRFKEKLFKQLCWLMGGPCVYDGLGMRESHQPLDIDKAQYTALVEDFQKAMRDEGVSFRTQNKLLKILAPLYRDVVAD